MCFSFMISMAARCSEVCGCGHDSLPAGEEGVKWNTVWKGLNTPMRRRAASMTAAPFSMVAMRIS